MSSARLYWENNLDFFAPKGLKIPVAVSAFPDELFQAPRSWTARAFPKLIYYNRLPKGGQLRGRCRDCTSRWTMGSDKHLVRDVIALGALTGVRMFAGPMVATNMKANRDLSLARYGANALATFEVFADKALPLPRARMRRRCSAGPCPVP